MKGLEQKFKKLTTRVGEHWPLRSRSPRPARNDHKLDHDDQADRSSTPTPALHAPTSDDSVGRSKSVTPITLLGTQAGVPDINDDKKSVPTIAVEESSTSLIPASTPSKKFAEVKTKNAQHDLVILHVAYILQKSSNLQGLILEIVKLSTKPGYEDIVQDCVGFTTRLIAALDSSTVAQADVEEAIVMLLKTIKTVDLNDRQKVSREIRSSIEEIEINHPDIPKIEQKDDSSCFSKLISEVLGVALPMLEIIKTGSSMIPVPMVRPLIGVVAGFLQAADQACNNFEWMRWLSTTAAECVIGIAVHCSEQTEQQWPEAIDTLQRKLSHIVQQAEEFCRRSVTSRFLQQGRDKGAVEMMKEDLKAAIGHFNTQVGMNIKLDLEKMSRQIEDISLETLPRLPSDKFSQDDHFQASRKDEIEDTLRWIEGSDGMRLFWIHGAAGIGKTTLAHRLFDLVKREGILGTFAYFSIGNDIHPKELVRMMARELSSLHPGCRHEVARAINACSGTHQSLDEYLAHFLVNPVAFLAYAGPLVVILDALDEWVHREQFLKALCQVKFPPTFSLKFIMTSRYSDDIKSIVNCAATRYELTPVSETVSRQYFEERFNDRTWRGPRPDEVRLDKLVKLADGLLIWAATVCTLVSTPHPKKSPLKILDEILSSSLNLGHEERMKRLYREALERIFPATENEEWRLKLFFSMIALREALPLTEFARVVDMRSDFIHDVCSRLRALQTRGTFHESMVQPAVELFHASFIEHLGQLNEAHGVLADDCVHFFKQVTEDDIAGILPPREAEQYISEHWVYHLQEAPLQKRSNLFLDIPNDHLRLWVGCLLSHLFRLGNKYGYGPGSDQDIDRAISHHQTSVESTPSSHADLASWFNNLAGWFNGLGSLYASHFRSTGNLQDIDRAISRHQSAVEFTPSGHIDLPSRFSDLGNLYLGRFKCTRNPQDIDYAIQCHREALELFPAPHLNRPDSLNNLASALSTRFEQKGDLEDLEESIQCHREVLKLIPAPHPNQSDSLNNLANALSMRFEQKGDLENLEESIQCHWEALELRPAPHPNRSDSLNNLASALSTQFEQKGDFEDLEKSIRCHQEALELKLPASHPNLSLSLNKLANALSTFGKQEGFSNLQGAITFYQETLHLLPTYHPLHSISRHLGIAFMKLHSITSQPSHLEAAMNAFRAAINARSSSVLDRFLAGTTWASNSHSSHPSALEAYQCTIALLPRLTMSGLNSDLQARQKALRHSNGLVHNAASCAISAGNLTQAIGFLEEAQRVFWSQSLQLRTPFDHLRSVAPDLAKKLHDLSNELEQGSFQRDVSRVVDDDQDDDQKRVKRCIEAIHFHRLDKDWNRTLEEVRNLDGFHDFLLPKSVHQLKWAVINRRIVTLNASEHRCDGLILSEDGVTHVPFPMITMKVAITLVQSLQLALSSHKTHSHIPDEIHANLRSLLDELPSQSRPDVRRHCVSGTNPGILQCILEMLWFTIVHPVVCTLGLERSDSPPRLWWCPTGPFAFLPLHAAGVYDSSGTPLEDASNYIISSYTPTPNHLLTPLPILDDTFKMLAVVEPSSLPYTLEELTRIKKWVSPKHLETLGTTESPTTVEAVLSHISRASIAHFACQGTQNYEKPLESALRVLPCDHIKISSIMKIPCLDASLAFLSACQTATGDDHKVPVHIAAAMLFAGFRGVVGTMWAIQDEDAPDVVDSFYGYLFKDGPTRHPDTTEAARALHFAVKKMRNEKKCSLERWVPFIHLGL